MAEMDRGVIEEEAGCLDLEQVKSGSDMTKMLLAQMQQNSILLQKIMLSDKSNDPIVSALASGSGSESGGSSTGAKGCVAREAYCRKTKDLDAIATAVRKNALAELGMDPQREDESLMRRYIERRIPLAEHKLLCHMATLTAEGWAIAYQGQNQQMLGYLGLVLMFIEQVALDQGRLQLGWLLTGLAEPNHHVHFNHQKRPGLKPFCRLANPIWVSANLAFLKELDFIEGRMDQVSKKKPQLPAAEDDGEKPGKPAPKKRKPKGRGKGADAEDGGSKDNNK